MAIPGSLESLNRLGALVAHVILVSCILIFSSRLAAKPEVEHWAGVLLLLTLVPLTYLLVTAGSLGRPPIYYLQISLMIVFLIIELLLDYLLKIPFRQERWMVITYVTLFFGATGGMLGVAATAGRAWAFTGIALFLTMAALAFVQRAKTGL